MSFVKNRLKSAREALGKRDYSGARDDAAQVLEYEPDNYNAYVFLGLAQLELGDHEKSEQAYRKAVSLNSEQLLAWQGLSKFYERVQKWEDHSKILHHLVSLYANNNDAVKCAESLQKLIEVCREHGSRMQLIMTLKLMLPDSPVYTTLLSLPPPDPTNPTSSTTYATQVAIHSSLPLLREIVDLVEKEEQEVIQKEIDKRRQRLGAPSLEQLKKDIQTEVLNDSQLPALYNEILMHPDTKDDLRRFTDSKLLHHKVNLLHALPITGDFSSAKEAVLKEVDELVNGAIILRIPDELAWLTYLSGMDRDIEGYDPATLGQYIGLFPASPLTKVLKAYCTYTGKHIYLEDVGNRESEDTAAEDPIDTIMDAQALIPDSVIACQIVAEVYLREAEYFNAIQAAERGLEIVRAAEVNSGRHLPRVNIGFKTVLVTSLVHFYPPKHHPRALSIIDEVLQVAPDNVACLMGRAHILQASQQWMAAYQLYTKVDKLLPEDLSDGLRAKEELAWCQNQVGEPWLAIGKLKAVLDMYEDGQSSDKARCLWRIGRCLWEIDDECRKEAYQCFILSLKASSDYAPSFTALGIYYADFATPPDPTRASKCFQKAFELDAREAEAARRLAEGFAGEGEWGLVEVVARRTIEGEGGITAGLKENGTASISRFLPTNIWAFKAIGAVELAHKNYATAIQAYQIALRADTDDQLSWLRLGEAYSKAGRHSAALKALTRAHELCPDDWVCSYFIGEVHRHAGDYKEAIDSYQSVLRHEPSETGSLMALAQTYLELGCAELSAGYASRTEQSCIAAIQTALQMMQLVKGFRALTWKVIGDAFSLLSDSSSFFNDDLLRPVMNSVVSLLPVLQHDPLSMLTSLTWLQENSPLCGIHALEVAIAVYNHRTSLGQDGAVQGSAYFDLGMALYMWATKNPSSRDASLAQDKAHANVMKALQMDPSNDVYWNGMGNLKFASQAKVAQHAYIRALEIHPKNVATWTNLGFLYLFHGDPELANEALYKVQTLDPDYALAWVGQAFVAAVNGDEIASGLLLEHAIDLSCEVTPVHLEYASKVFERQRLTIGTSDQATLWDALLPAQSVLNQYCKRHPTDATALHLCGLLCERLGQLDIAADLIKRALCILESTYEECEAKEVEKQFAIACSNLARLSLALGEPQEAIEGFNSTLGLLPEEDSDNETDTALRVQALSGTGLAHFRLSDVEMALNQLENALQASGNNSVLRGRVDVLLGQVMWSAGTEEYWETAKSHLLECINTDPENLIAINTLAGMGILTDDESLVDAALTEVLSLTLDKRRELDPQRDVDYLLLQHHLSQNDTSGGKSVVQHAVFIDPGQPSIREKVAIIALQTGHIKPAIAILSGSKKNTEQSSTSLSLQAIAYAKTNNRLSQRIAQKAIMLTPWSLQAWKTFVYVHAINK